MAAPSACVGQHTTIEAGKTYVVLPTLEARLLRQEEGSVCPSYCVLSIAAVRLQHLMERSHSVALLELRDTLSHLVDSAGNIVALVAWRGVGHPFGDLPVFWVAARDGDLDHHLAGLSLWDGRVDDLDLGPCVDDGFLHVDLLGSMPVNGLRDCCPRSRTGGRLSTYLRPERATILA